MNPNDWNQAGTPSDPNLATPQDVNQSGTMAQNIPNPWNTADPVSATPQAVPTPDPVSQDPVMQAPVMTPDPAAPMDSTVTPAVSEEGMTDVVPRDPNVLNFMASAVIEKHGENADPAFLKKESERLYDEFGEKLVDYFEPMLSKEQIDQFDGLMNQGSSQDQLLAFLMSCIPDLTSQIEKVLLEYKEKYIFGF